MRLEVYDLNTGVTFPVRARDGMRWMGWGSRPRVLWSDADGDHVGALVKSTGSDLDVEDAGGVLHLVPRAVARVRRFDVAPLPVDLQELSKSAGAPKAGQRWITVHPHGDEGHGVPILIQEQPDGTHRVVAGAGGKLTHLILKNVGAPQTPEQRRAADAERRKARKDKEEEQTDDERAAAHKSKSEIAAEKKDRERQLVEKVRSTVGGVREDITEEKRKELRDQGLREHQIKAILRAHEKAQYREAVARSREVLSGLAERVTSQAETAATLGADEKDRALHEARNLAAMSLDEDEQASRQAARARQTGRERLTGGDPEVARRAAEEVLEQIKAGPDDALRERATKGDAVAEVAKRAVEHADKARKLAEVAEQLQGEQPPAELPEEALKALGENGDALSAAEKRDKLVAAAGAAARKAEVERARADQLSTLQQEDPEAAWRALEYSDGISRMARERGQAVRAGLVDTVMVGARDVDHAAAAELARDFVAHQRGMRELKAAMQASDTSRLDAARRAFTLNSSEGVDDDAVAQAAVEEEVRRGLTENLLGVVSHERAEYQTAVGAGHHDALADVTMGLMGGRAVDRLTLDALGLRNAAVLARHALEQAGHDPDQVLEALERHHVAQVTKASVAALAQAEKVAPGLRAKIEEVGDFERAAADLHLHARDIKAAQETVGAAIGKLEATAALSQTFRQKQPDVITMDGKRGGLEQTLAWLHAAGLRPGDYLVDHGDKTVTIPKRSWGRLLVNEGPEEAATRLDVERIKAGHHDEEGWLPAGILRREATTFTAPVPAAPSLAEPLNLKGADTVEAIQAAVEQHAGLRLAEGEHPADVMSDLLSATRMRGIEHQEHYVQAVRSAFPLLGEDGRRVKMEDNAVQFQALAEKAMRAKYGTEVGAFHAQDIRPEDAPVREAVFRALAAHPESAVAFKAPGELTPQDQRVIREAAYKRMGVDPKVREDEAAYKAALADLGAEPDPNKGTMSLFGPRTPGPSPEWREWKQRQAEVFAKYPRTGLKDAVSALGPRPAEPAAAQEHDAKVAALHEAAAKAPTAWSRFVETHGSLQLAQQAIQDEMRGRFVERFHEEHGRITGRGLRLGVTEVTNPERHVKAVASPEEAEALQKEARALYATLQQREGGRFSAEGEGAVRAKYTRFLEQETVARQSQLGMFGARAPEPKPDEPAFKPPAPAAGQRYTLGQRAEAQLGSVVGVVGKQFEPGKPIGLFPGLNMDGQRAPQQRVIKQLQRVKRVGGFLGTGSGKSLISIGGFTEAHARGEATHGLYLVPSAVQSQFGAEMLRYTEPGRYSWATGEGKSHEERVALLKDKDTHMRVFTHQSFRDTALRITADHHGVTPAAMKERLAELKPQQRAQLVREAFDAAGIPRHYTYYDEAHTAESQSDTDASTTHLIRSAVTHPLNASHYLHGTGTPVKNNAREMASVAEAIDPDRYHDRNRFMQDFGQATQAAHEAVRRELSPRIFTAKIEPEGVTRADMGNPRIAPGFMGRPGKKVSDGAPLELEPEHQKLVDRVQQAYETARKARSEPRDKLAGPILIDAMRTLSPRPFEGRPPEEHAAIAERLLPSLGVIRESAMRRAINQAPPEINTKLKAMVRVIKHDLAQGRASIAFSDSARETAMIHEALLREGVRSVHYHGGLGAKERDEARLGFQPEGGTPAKYDVMVATSSAEAGVNLQRGSVLHHFDVPQTQKSHQQRSGRIHRQGQKQDVDIHDWYTDTDYERNARGRLRDKRQLASVLEDVLPHQDEHGIASHYRQVLAERHQEAA